MKTFLAAFMIVFLAELGDKTQLAALGLAAKEKSFWSVFLGTALALVVASALGVALGRLLGETLPLRVIRFGAGFLFILLGVLMLWGKI